MGRICEYCEKAFIPRRSDAIYCSQSCKQLAYVSRKIKVALIKPDIKSEENSLEGIAECIPCKEQFLDTWLYNKDLIAEEMTKNNNVETYPQVFELIAVLKTYNIEESSILDELKEQILLTCLRLREVSFKNPKIQCFYREFLNVVEIYLSFIVAQEVTRKELKKARNTIRLLTQWEVLKCLTPALLNDIYTIKNYTFDLLLLAEKGKSMQFIPQRDKKIMLIAYRYLLESYLSKNKLYSTNNKTDE